jgi:hypothetical protein
MINKNFDQRPPFRTWHTIKNREPFKRILHAYSLIELGYINEHFSNEKTSVALRNP